jgi:hypothetical protein
MAQKIRLDDLALWGMFPLSNNVNGTGRQGGCSSDPRPETVQKNVRAKMVAADSERPCGGGLSGIRRNHRAGKPSSQTERRDAIRGRDDSATD